MTRFSCSVIPTMPLTGCIPYLALMRHRRSAENMCVEWIFIPPFDDMYRCRIAWVSRSGMLGKLLAGGRLRKCVFFNSVMSFR